MLYQQRLDKAAEMRDEGVNPYANDFRVDTRAVEFFNTYDAIESKEEVDAIETVHRMAGRVMAVNKFGKAAFIRVQDGTADSKRDNGEYTDRYQVYVRKNSVDEASFQAFKRLDIGDFVGISGTPMRTKTGELTLNATEFRVLTKSLRPLPESGIFQTLRLVTVSGTLTWSPMMRFAESLEHVEVSLGFVIILLTVIFSVETPMMQGIAGQHYPL